MNDLRIPWGGLTIPLQHLDPHYTILGCPGSGKTLTIKMMLKAILPLPVPVGGTHAPLRFRALIYDPKRDMLPVLSGLRIADDDIVVLNPFDIRAKRWDIAKDIVEDRAAQELASNFIPVTQNESQPFFPKAARQLVHALVLAFQQQAPGNWNLHDIVEACSSHIILRKFMMMTHWGRAAVATILDGDEDTRNNVLSTLATQIMPFGTVASLWRTLPPERSYCLSDSVPSTDPEKPLPRHKVVVLGHDATSTAVLDPLNRLFFQRFSALLQDGPETKTDLSWVFLDEARLLGELDGLGKLMLTGRSKGVRVILGFQDVEGMRDAYTPMRANELMGLCGNVALLRMNNPESQAWASRLVGSYEYWQQSTSHGDSWTDGRWTNTTNTSSSLTKREAILESQFRQFPLASPSKGIPGVYMAPAMRKGAWDATVPKAFLDQHLPLDGDAPGFIPRKPSDQKHVPWTKADEIRLGLVQVPPPTVEPKATPAPSTSAAPAAEPSGPANNGQVVPLSDNPLEPPAESGRPTKAPNASPHKRKLRMPLRDEAED